jgi:hypothetical protein
MARHRGEGLVSQRTLAVDPEAEPSPPVEPPPAEPPQPASPEPPTETPPRVYPPVVSSSEGLWERKLRWWRTRERVEAARGRGSVPGSRE